MSAPTTLKLATWNVLRPAGARTAADVVRFLKAKLDEHDIDVVALQEVAACRAALRKIPGYTLIEFDDRSGGDNAILVRSTLPHDTGAQIQVGPTGFWWVDRKDKTKKPVKSWGRSHVTVLSAGVRFTTVHLPPAIDFVKGEVEGPEKRGEVYGLQLHQLDEHLDADPDEPHVVLGDWNENDADNGVVSPGGWARRADLQLLGGRRIDWAAGRGVTASKPLVVERGTGGNTSDHPFVLWTVTVPAPVTPAPAPAPPTKEATVAKSQNGYTANDRSRVSSRPIPGTTRTVTVVKGAPGDLLLRFAGEFDKQVENIDGPGVLDDWGYAERPVRGSSTTLSNHASGTAIDLNATRHPLGKVNTFTQAQDDKIHALLRKYEGCIRWGGDYTKRKDEMHFEIVKSPEECARVLAKLSTPARVTPPGSRDLKVGAEGQDVAFVQRKVGITADGVFGPRTKAAVEAWERFHNSKGKKPKLLADGVVGTGTWTALGVTPTYGKKG